MKSIANLWHSLVCGCHREARHHLWRGWARLAYPLMSAAALAWFLLRVIPKPSRAAYPCQRAAFPLASSFVLWLIGIQTGFITSLGLKKTWRAWLRLLLVVALGGLVWAAAEVIKSIPAAPMGSPVAAAGWVSSVPPNTPKGVARGIFPGRVTWIRDTNATPWNGSAGNWWQSGNINQPALDRMVSTSLRALTGTNTDEAAWNLIFHYYNRTHGRGDVGYQTNEAIAVKINLNNCYGGYTDADNNIDASPQAVLSLLSQLVIHAGVPQNMITIYDATPTSSRCIPNRIYTPDHAAFPSVNWVDGQGLNGRLPANWVAGAISYSVPSLAKCGANLPACAVNATYLIDFALLKGHQIAGVTLCGKNHFGSIQSPGSDHNNYVNQWKHPMGSYAAWVDMMGCPNLGAKTILNIIDGLYGDRTNVGDVTKDRCGWTNLFCGQWSASYFMSLDPVAVDSVGVDFLTSEFGNTLGYSQASDGFAMGSVTNCDNYLQEAALANNPPSGTPYTPNGVAVGSLGVFEHWNNSINKQYSRNLSTNGIGIELVTLQNTSAMSVTLLAPTNGSVFLPGTNVLLQAGVTTNFSQLNYVAFYTNNVLLGISSNASPSITWSNAPLGQWAVFAVAYDTDNYAVTSAVVNVIIRPNLAVAGALYVDLRASDASAATATWTNFGTLGNFTNVSALVQVANVAGTGVPGIQFDGSSTAFTGPASVSDIDGGSDRSIEVWIYNPAIGVEETILMIGHDGTTGSKVAFNYGSNLAYGACAQWGAYDVGWNNATNIPAAGTWHYLVYTYDGATTCKIYVDGALCITKTLPGQLTTFAGEPLLIGAERGNTANTPPSAFYLSGYLNSLRVHGGVLSASDVTNNYAFGPALLLGAITTNNTIVMNASDAVTTSSFNSGLNWTGGAAPTAGTAYQTAAFLLRTPQNTTSLAFLGDSLEVQAGGILRDKTAATITVTNLILDDTATVELTQPNGVNSAAAAGTLAGGITLNGTAVIHAGIATDTPGERFTISSVISGMGGLTTTGSTGNILLAGTNTYTGTTTVGAGTLTVNTNGAINSASVAGLGEIIVGNTAGVNAVMNIAGGTVNATRGVNPAFTSGALSGASGFVNMTSGTLTTANGTASELHVGETAGGYGAFDLSGGTVTLSGYFVVGANGGGNGVFNMSGGSVTANGEFLTIANLNGGTGVVNMSGGTYSSPTATVGGIRLCESANANATLNVSGSAALSLGPGGLSIGYANSACAATVNLLGGTVTTSQVLKNAAATGIFNFHGGTLKASTANTTFMTGLTSANVFGEGAIIDDGGFAITIAQALLAPTGSGVRSIPVATGGSGYLDTPIVTITGGGGTGASAVAQVSSGGAVTNIAIVNPGTGYTSAPTVTLFGGGYTTAATLGTVAIAANATNGGLTKQGSGTLTFTGASTYGGTTTINAGNLALTGTGSIAGTPLISIASRACFDVSGKISGLVLGGSQTLSNSAASTGRLAGNITNNLGVISVTYTNGIPAFAVTNGTLALAAGSTFTINNTGPALAAGSYLVIATNAAGCVAGTAPAAVTVGGTGTVGISSLSLSNSQLYLLVTALSTNAYLTSLVLNPAGLTSAFVSNTFCYAATNAYGSTPTVTASNANLTATNQLIYNGIPIGRLANGAASSPLILNVNPAVTNVVRVQVTAQDGVTMNIYTVNVSQWPCLVTKPALTNCLRGGMLTLNWPLANTGYRLLVQTNNLNGGVSGNPDDWAEVLGSAATNQACITLLSTNVNEFYRLVYP